MKVESESRCWGPRNTHTYEDGSFIGCYPSDVGLVAVYADQAGFAWLNAWYQGRLWRAEIRRVLTSRGAFRMSREFAKEIMSQVVAARRKITTQRG